jgi:hypothetical protein
MFWRQCNNHTQICGENSRLMRAMLWSSPAPRTTDRPLLFHIIQQTRCWQKNPTQYRSTEFLFWSRSLHCWKFALNNCDHMIWHHPCNIVFWKYANESPLRPIISMVGVPAYTLAECLIGLLGQCPSNCRYHGKNYKDFIHTGNTLWVTPEDILVTFDIVYLFTKVPTGDALRAISCQTRQCCQQCHFVIFLFYS